MLGKMNPNATGYALYSGDFDDDGKTDYGLIETITLDGKMQDWLSVFKIRSDNSVQVQKLDLFQLPDYHDWGGSRYEELKVQEIKIDRSEPGITHNDFECRLKFRDPKGKQPDKVVYLDISYGQGGCANEEYIGTTFFYCYRSIDRDCDVAEEVKTLKFHSAIKEDQYVEIQNIDSFQEDGISLYGVDREKEEQLYIRLDDKLYPLDIPWKGYMRTKVYNEDFDGDGEKEIAVLLDQKALYVVEKEKDIIIHECPRIHKTDVPKVLEYITKENVKMSDDLFFRVEDGQLIYEFYVYTGEYLSTDPNGYYRNKLYYSKDGSFEFDQSDIDATMFLAEG